MVDDAIVIQGAREHNLKNLSVRIPRERLVVITGVSGSGKSTLAFDLLFAEGQRRFLDAMCTYARQFVEQMARPDVDLITGIPPTVSIEQRNSRGGGKSTVATVTELYHFFRLLFARLGTQFCPECELPVEAQTPDALGQRLTAEAAKRGDLLLLAPVVKNRKGFHTEVAEWAHKHGYTEVRADGTMHATDQPLRLDRYREHDVEIVIGVLEPPSRGKRAARANGGKPAQMRVDEALKIGHGTLLAMDNHGRMTVHSTTRACPGCGRSFESLDPKQFSYNSAQGWCPKCRGFGELFYLPDVERGARADAIEESWFEWQEGKRELCPECHGARLHPVARAVRFLIRDAGPLAKRGPTLETLARMTVEEAAAFFLTLKLHGNAAAVARDILPEIRERLKFLNEVGLGYLQLGRAVPTLSGGEAQRIRLAAQLGSNLSGVLYVLDEPTIGLHARDNERLLETLAKLRQRGNTVVVVEHDEATMRQADYIIDLGPGAGRLGGEVVAAGTLKELLRHPDSITGQYLRLKKSFPARGARRPVPKRNDAQGWLVLEGAAKNNLKKLSVRLPLNRLVLITGISGSGKSTLVRECLLPALKAKLDGTRPPDASCGTITAGADAFKAVYEVDQSPIGRTPRSTPATYVGFFDDIRALFAQVPEARLRGYGPGRFSFNSAQGRCPECEGAGVIKLEMNFMPPAFVRCESCNGLRFNPETLDIQFHGKTIAEVLDLSVAEAREFFQPISRIRRCMEALHDTGLDYLKLGQTSPTLSGGEAQRVKLVTHLLTGFARVQDERALPPSATPRKPAKHCCFILEEPTIGLHMADVQRLVEVLQRLVDAGHSVVVIEHNLDLIAEADWIVDLGPEGGDHGGRIVAEGTPEQIPQCSASHTGKFLLTLLQRE